MNSTGADNIYWLHAMKFKALNNEMMKNTEIAYEHQYYPLEVSLAFKQSNSEKISQNAALPCQL
jgi:hypothetical protein